MAWPGEAWAWGPWLGVVRPMGVGPVGVGPVAASDMGPAMWSRVRVQGLWALGLPCGPGSGSRAYGRGACHVVQGQGGPVMWSRVRVQGLRVWGLPCG